MPQQKLVPVLLTTASVGVMIWTIPCGSLHAYVASVDWEAIDRDQISQVVTTRSVLGVCFVGFTIGFLAQAVAIFGAAIRREAVTLFAPVVVGILFGVLQGVLVGTDLWGYTDSNIPLRSLPTRLLAGAFCGFVAVPITMGISVFIRKMVRSSPQSAIDYYNRGVDYLNMGECDRAISDFTEAIRLNPQHAGAWNNRGAAYRLKGQYAEAIKDYSEVLRLGFSEAEYVYFNRGIAYHSIREYDRAIADYTEAIRRNSKDSRFFSNRGGAHFAQGEYDKTIADCTKAIKLNPREATFYTNRAKAYRAVRDDDAATRDERKALELGK